VIRLLCTLAITILVGGTLLAQGLGTLNGLVRKDEIPVANTPVEITNLETNEKLQSQTDSEGKFKIERLRYGSYQFSVMMAGYPTVSMPFRMHSESLSETFCISPAPCTTRPSSAPLSRAAPIIEGPQVADHQPIKVGNGGSIGVTSTAFGLVIALLKDQSIPPGGNTTLSVVFTPFSLKSKASQNGKLEVIPTPRKDRGVTFETQSSPPAGSVGNQVWVWGLAAANDFNGSDIMIDVAMTLSDAKGNVLATGPATTPPLSLKPSQVDKRSWLEKNKDLVGPILAAVITGLFGFVAGRTHKHKGKRKRTGQQAAPTARVSGAVPEASEKAQPSDFAHPTGSDRTIH
jgi:hypothetical protein